ncbi:hypothetical protein ACFOZY_00400 [Chungangia koreensis]|uniref:Uncharacterized protein n=1 Tax=Chungangia koreensis TaxID=752657 RepID=A0ABV8X196_9LACT
MKNKMGLAALGLGAAYLLRNKDSRAKISEQFKKFGSSPMRWESDRDSNDGYASTDTGRKKGILGGLFG